MGTKFLNTLAAATTLVGIVATAGIANAASLTKTASTNFEKTDFFDKTLSVEQFDSSLGELESVEISFTGEIKANGSITNNANSANFIFVLGGEQITRFGTIKLSNLNLNLDGVQLDLNTMPENFVNLGTIATNETKDIPELTATDSVTQTLSKGQNDLSAFIGNGNLNFLFDAQAQTQIFGSGNFSSIVETVAKGSVAVTYNYDESKSVPEPSSILGFGLIAGVGMLSLRKKSWLEMSKA